MPISNAAGSTSGPDDLITLFYTFFSNILDSVAIFKPKQPKRKSYYWLDVNTRSLGQVCHKVGWRQKHDRLTVCF